MSDQTYDPYEFSQGLPDKYGGVIEEAYVAYNPEYQDGKIALLHLVTMTDDPEIGEAGRTTALYTLGKGWEPAEGGKSAVHESGKKRKLNANSGVALLTQAALDIGVNLRERGLPWESKTWTGLDFEWERKEFSFKNDEGKEQTYGRMLPVALRGQAGTGTPPQAAAAAAPPTAPAAQAAPAPTPSTPEPTQTTNGAIDGMTKVGLIKLAKEVKANGGTHDQFMERAFVGGALADGSAIPAVAGNQAVEQAVMDASPTGVFAQA